MGGRYIWTLFLLTFHVTCYTQSGRSEWLFGSQGRDDTLRIGNYVLDFQGQSAEIRRTEMGFQAENSAQIFINDELIVCNGCKVMNYSTGVDYSGDDLNPGEFRRWCTSIYHYPGISGNLFLPHFYEEETMSLFHVAAPDDPFDLEAVPLYLSRLNIKQNTIARANQLLEISDYDRTSTSIRHGNGRDWWVIVPHSTSHNMSVAHISEGELISLSQRPTTESNIERDASAQLVASPQGDRIAYSNTKASILLMDFNRCTGAFSEIVYKDFGEGDLPSACGVSFSASGRYLYVSYCDHIVQYDLQSDPQLYRPDTIALYDGHYVDNPVFRTNFGRMLLGVDKKIYIIPTGQNYHMHVIHNPDQPSELCGFEQRAIELPTRHARTMPNIPHYELSDWSDSPCDTLGIDNGVITSLPELRDINNVQIFPNPASNAIQIELPEIKLYTYRVINSVGQEIGRGQIESDMLNLDVSDYLDGLYWISLHDNVGSRYRGEFVKIE